MNIMSWNEIIFAIINIDTPQELCIDGIYMNFLLPQYLRNIRKNLYHNSFISSCETKQKVETLFQIVVPTTQQKMRVVEEN